MEETRRPRRLQVSLFWLPLYSGHDSGSYDPGYPSGDYDYCPDDPAYPSGDYDSCPDDSGYPSGDYDFCSDNSGKLSIPDGRVKATASMELSHLRGQRGRYASSEAKALAKADFQPTNGSIRCRSRQAFLHCLNSG